MKDVGVDVAVVTATEANLRQGPSTADPILVKLKQGSVLALVDRQKVGGSWFNVIHVESSKEGWINSGLVKVSYTQKRQDTQLFREERAETEDNPKVVVGNDSSRTIYLKVGEERYSLPPSSERTVHPSPGTLSYYASAPGVLPAFGKKDFKAGYVYTWRFYIRTTVTGGGRRRRR